jgi:hypothetical protein
MNTTTRKLLTATALVVAVAVTATGCGKDGKAKAEATSKPAAAATASADPTSVATTDPTAGATPSLKPFTGPGVDAFGQQAVKDAYVWSTAFLLKNGTDDSLLRLESKEVTDLAFTNVLNGLTPSSRELFRGYLKNIRTGAHDRKSTVAVSSIARYGMGNVEGYTLSPVSTRQKYAGGATEVGVTTIDGVKMLVLAYEVGIRYQYTKDADGKPYVFEQRKKMRLFLKPTGDKAQPWLLDGWLVKDEIVKGPNPDPSPAGAAK